MSPAPDPGGAGAAAADLERRYARWAALCYPAGYRRTRGSELVDTYLALAAPGRRHPSVADVADLAAGGLRQRLRVVEDVAPGFRLAGLLALMTATALATGWVILDGSAPRPRGISAGPLLLSLAAWVPWLPTAVVYAAAPHRWFRRAAGLGVLVTAGVVAAALLTGLPRPPMFVLLPQLVLGVVALGAARQYPWWVRLMPIAATAVSVPVIVRVATGGVFYGEYYWWAATVLPAAAVTLLIGAALLALGLAGARRDHRGAWALLVLLTPIGMLALPSLGVMFDNSGPGRPIVPVWSAMVTASVLVAVVGPALLALALAARQRLAPSRRPSDTGVDHCPTCGTPSPPA